MDITNQYSFDILEGKTLREISKETVNNIREYVDTTLFKEASVDYYLRNVYVSLSYVNLYYYFEYDNLDLSFIFKVSRSGDKIFTDYYSAEFAYVLKDGETISKGPYVIEDFELRFIDKTNKILGGNKS
jgi:hypothetical protein